MRFVRVTAQTEARKEFMNELKRVTNKLDTGHVNASTIMTRIEDAQDLFIDDPDRAWAMLRTADAMIG